MFKLIITSVRARKDANIIVDFLINNNLAACTHILSSVQSAYKWKNKTCKNNEYLVLIKSTISMVDEIKKYILKYHPYEIPELISIDFDILNKEYENWFVESIGKENEL